MVALIEYYDLILRGATKELLIATLRQSLDQHLKLLAYIAFVALLGEAVLQIDNLRDEWLCRCWA